MSQIQSLWRNWLARSAVNRKVGGSSPPRDVDIFCGSGRDKLVPNQGQWAISLIRKARGAQVRFRHRSQSQLHLSATMGGRVPNDKQFGQYGYRTRDLGVISTTL